MSQTIKVQSCNLKISKPDYNIYEVLDEQGNKYDYLGKEPLIGTVSGEVTPNANAAYNSRLKVIKDKKAFAPRDYTFDKRRVALECAVSLVNSSKIEAAKLNDCRDKFFDYLNQ
jgi:hypothetical protein